MNILVSIGLFFTSLKAVISKRIAPTSTVEGDSLTYWRIRILTGILYSGMVLGSLAIIPGFVLSIKEKIWGLLISYVIIWLIGLNLLISRRIGYKTRALATIFIVYAIGLVIIINVGIFSGGPIWLFAFTVLVAILLGTRAAVGAICLNAVTLSVLSWLIFSGKFGIEFQFFNNFERMISAGASFILLNSVITVSVAVLVKGIISSHQKEKLLTSDLEQEHKKLSTIKQNLEIEVEERKQTETELRKSKEKFRDLADSLPQIVFEADTNGNLTFINNNALKITGYSEDDFTKGLNVFDILIPKDRERALVNINKLKETKKVNPEGNEYTISKKDNSTLPVQIHARPIFHEGKPIGFRGIIIDLSSQYKAAQEREKMEAKIQRAQKMEVIGTVAGGVAHDLNNILSGIVSYPDLLLMDIPDDSPLKKPILTIKSSGEKASAVVQDLLTLTRRGVISKEVVNLNDIIYDYLSSPEFRNLIPSYSNIQIETDLQEDLLNISGSPIHLTKTVMNLISNAAEALPDGGNIRISTSNRYIDTPIATYDEVKQGDYVVLTISDNGIGIPQNDIERIFEPFFTKKIMGRSGTGLGMAVVWGTVKDHRGYVDVKSVEDKGSTFTLFFPVTREKPTTDKPLDHEMEIEGSGETILVVDDIKEQREIASAILLKLGFSVTTVSSGEEAIEYLKKNNVDLLVLDMIMDPGIDGLETFKRIREIHPEQKAIIASGYAETQRVKQAQQIGAGAYIKKPYTLDNMAQAVRQELNIDL